MIDKPSKEDLKTISNLNKAYEWINKGIALIKKHAPKDNDIFIRLYRMEKEQQIINKKILKLLESKQIDTEFNKIIEANNKKKK